MVMIRVLTVMSTAWLSLYSLSDVQMAQTPEIISSLCRNRMSWDEAYNKFPRFVFQRDPEDK